MNSLDKAINDLCISSVTCYGNLFWSVVQDHGDDNLELLEIVRLVHAKWLTLRAKLLLTLTCYICEFWVKISVWLKIKKFNG